MQKASKLRLGCMNHFNLKDTWLPLWVKLSGFLTQQTFVRSGTNRDRNNTFPRIFPVICWPVYRECIGLENEFHAEKMARNVKITEGTCHSLTNTLWHISF